jgi:hypothetical protein
MDGRLKQALDMVGQKSEQYLAERRECDRLRLLLACAATGLALACEGGVTDEQLTQLWIDPHGLRRDIANALGEGPLDTP